MEHYSDTIIREIFIKLLPSYSIENCLSAFHRALLKKDQWRKSPLTRTKWMNEKRVETGRGEKKALTSNGIIREQLASTRGYRIFAESRCATSNSPPPILLFSSCRCDFTPALKLFTWYSIGCQFDVNNGVCVCVGLFWLYVVLL